MELYECSVCKDGGILDEDVFCDCPRGEFYEDKHERALQTFYDILDSGLDSYDADTEDDLYTGKYSNLYLLSYLPFYDGINITDGTEYDDTDDSYYESDCSDHDFYDSDPWISHYGRDLHDMGDCEIPCDICAYEDAVW